MATSEAAHQAAVKRAKAALLSLPQDDSLFQQCVLDKVTIEAVFEQLRHYSVAHKRKLSTRVLDRFHHCTSWMLNISPSIDVAVNASAGIACPVWAPIKFILMISREDCATTETIINVVQGLADNLPRIDLYERFRDEEVFQVALVNLFADLAEFAACAYRFLKHRAPIRLSSLIKRNSKDRFSQIISDIQRRTKVVDDTAIALHQLRAEQLLKEAQATSQVEARLSCIQWLKTSGMWDHHERNLDCILPTTCEWILKHQLFCSWFDQERGSQERHLIVHGPPGSGKSVLSSFTYRFLKENHEKHRIASGNTTITHDYIPLYFAFSAHDINRMTLASLARHCLSQILEHDQSETACRLISALRLKASVTTTEFFETFQEACVEMHKPIIMVIDGIDECRDDHKDFWRIFTKLSEATPSLRALLLGQTHSLAKLLSSAASSIYIDQDLVRQDMDVLISTGVDQCSSLWNSALRQSVSEALLIQSESMFLYAKLVLDYLKTIPSEAEVWECLQELPNGLEKMYELLLVRLSNGLERHQLRTVSFILSVMTCSGRPLALEEFRLTYALATDASSDLDPQQTLRSLLRLEPDALVELCGGLLGFTDGFFHIIHASASAFLTRSSTYQPSVDRFQGLLLRVSSPTAHDMMSRVCLKVFRYADSPGKDQSPIKDCWEPLLEYAKMYTPYHLNNSNRPMDELRQVADSIVESPLLTNLFLNLRLHDNVPPDALLEHLILFENVLRFGEHDDEPVESLLESFENQFRNVLEAEEFIEAAIEDAGETAPSASSNLEPEMESSEHSNLTTRAAPAIEQSPTSSLSLGNPCSNPSKRLTLPQRRLGRVPVYKQRKFAAQFGEPWRLSYNTLNRGKLDLAVSFLRRLDIKKPLQDPLRIVWERMKAAAKTSSPLLMSAITWYLWRWDRDDEAYEIGVECYKRLQTQDTVFRTAHELLMGLVAFHCGEYAEGVLYTEQALKNVDRYPLLKPFFNDAYIRYILAESYFEDDEPAISLDVMRHIRQNGSYKTLNGNNIEGFYLLQGKVEFECGSMDAAINSYEEFRSLCYQRYPDLKTGEWDKWPTNELTPALWKTALYRLEKGDLEGAMKTFQEFEEICTSTIEPLDPYDKEALDGYVCLIQQQKCLALGEENLINHIKLNCLKSNRDDCHDCFTTLKSQYVAVINAWEHHETLDRPFIAFMNHTGAYRKAHDELSRNSHRRRYQDTELGRIFYYEFLLYNDVGRKNLARLALWESLSVWHLRCLRKTLDETLEYRTLTGILIELSRQEMWNECFAAAAECAWAASHFVLALDPQEDKYLYRRAFMTSKATCGNVKTYTTTPKILQDVQLDLLNISRLRQGYRASEALLDLEVWHIAQEEYMRGRRDVRPCDYGPRSAHTPQRRASINNFNLSQFHATASSL